MQKIQYLSFHLLLILTTCLSLSCSPSEDFSGVYAGVRLSINPLGGGMDRTDEVFLFRSDKTFTDQLDKKDWKTAVKGKYEIKGSKLYLHYTNGGKDNFTITKSGNLDAGTFVLFKMELDNSIPKGSYRFKFISGSGGMATGTTYVGTSNHNTLHFDGKGKFSTDRQSTTVIAGDHIGGGTKTNSDGKGTYTLKDGTLTLDYANGARSTHSFFASAGDEKNKAMAVIDGSFYFTEEVSKRADNDQSELSSAQLPNAAEVFSRARNVHGGQVIDRLQSYAIEATFSGIKVISYNDVSGKRFRNEMYLKDKLIVVEQIGPNGGWLWNNGKKSPSDAKRLKEATYSSYTGILGLHKKNSTAFSKGTVAATKEGYSVIFTVDGHQFTYLLDRSYRVLGSGYRIGNTKQSSAYSDFKTIGGINMPFTTVTSDGKNKITMKYHSIQINEQLATDWKEL